MLSIKQEQLKAFMFSCLSFKLIFLFIYLTFKHPKIPIEANLFYFIFLWSTKGDARGMMVATVKHPKARNSIINIVHMTHVLQSEYRKYKSNTPRSKMY